MTDWIIILAIFAAINLGLILLTSVESLRTLKTRVTALATAAIGAIQTTGIDFISDPKTFGMVMIGLGVTMGILRELTKKSFD